MYTKSRPTTLPTPAMARTGSASIGGSVPSEVSSRTGMATMRLTARMPPSVGSAPIILDALADDRMAAEKHAAASRPPTIAIIGERSGRVRA